MVNRPQRWWTKWKQWSQCAAACVLLPLLMGADEKAAPLDRIDAFTRAKLIMAILGLVLLGVGLVVMVMMGGRYVRRLARHRPEPMRPTVGWRLPKRLAPEVSDSEAVDDETDVPRDDDNPPGLTQL